MDKFAITALAFGARTRGLAEIAMFKQVERLLLQGRVENVGIGPGLLEYPLRIPRYVEHGQPLVVAKQRWQAGRPRVSDLPAMHVLRNREPCSDVVRNKKRLDCKEALVLLEKFRNITDVFVEGGGFLGDCSLAAAWTGFANRGVVLMDASKEAVDAFRSSA